MPVKRAQARPQPKDGDLTMRQAVAQQLQGKVAGCLVSWKFGHASFQTDHGKVFCFVTRDGHLAMKLPAERIAPLLENGSALPLRMGARTMREWVVVPAPESEVTLRLLAEARTYVASLPAADPPAKPRDRRKAK